MTEEERAEYLEALILSVPAAASVTPELLSRFLQGFRLTAVRDPTWFASQIRPIIFVTARHRIPKGNAEVRDALLDFADRLRGLFLDNIALERDAGEACWQFAKELEPQRTEFWAKNALAAYFDRESFVWLAKFYEAVALRLDEQKQPPKWRAKSKRNARVFAAANLIPVFEAGFGRRATLDKWPSPRGTKTLGPWAEFYQWIMAEALEEHATPDLEGVLTDARRLLNTSGYSRGDLTPK